MQIAKRSGRLLGEAAFDVLARVKEEEGKGRDIVSFAIGEPDFDTPQRVKDAAIRALQEGATHYTPSPGTAAFRQAVAKKVSAQAGVAITPQQVLAFPGVKPVLFCSLMSIIDEGDEVVMPTPGFPAYGSLIRYAGGTPVPLPLREDRGFGFDARELRRLVGPKTSAIIINSPHNPTGGVLTDEQLQTVADLAEEHDLWVVSDEVYRAFVYDGGHTSFLSLPGMRERTILVDGFSKTYAMTGWRLGYGVMPDELVPRVSLLVTNSVSCTSAFTQAAGVAALDECDDDVAAMVEEYRVRRDLIVEGLNGLPGVRCPEPPGAFYAFANVTELCARLGLDGAEALQDYLLEHAGVAVLARSCFGDRFPGERDEYLRFCYATDRARIGEGIDRLAALLGHNA